MNQIVTATARKSASKPQTGKVRGLEVEVIQNGFLVRCRREVKAAKGDYPSYVEPEKIACKNVGELVKYIKAELGESPEHEAAESKAYEKAEHSGKGAAAAEEKAEEG